MPFGPFLTTGDGSSLNLERWSGLLAYVGAVYPITRRFCMYCPRSDGFKWQLLNFVDESFRMKKPAFVSSPTLIAFGKNKIAYFLCFCRLFCLRLATARFRGVTPRAGEVPA